MQRTLALSFALAGGLAIAGAPLGAAQAPNTTPASDPAAQAASLQRVPILLVPGWGDDAADLATLETRFVAAGWPEDRVARLSFADDVGSNELHASEIAVAVADLIRVSGSSEVDVVAHSMGGLALRRYLSNPAGRSAVRRAVFLATPHRGTIWGAFAWGTGAAEMVPGSDFLDALNAVPWAEGEVDALAIRTPVDTHVMPGSSAVLPEARNVEVCCPSHQGLKDDAETFTQVASFLSVGPDGLP